MAKRIIMTRGIPASGKDFWAKQEMDKHPGVYVRSNKDLLRECLHFGQWTRHNEKITVSVRDAIVVAALQDGKSVIVSDTGFAESHATRLRELAKQHGAEFEIKDFTDVPLENCIERDRKRDKPVGEKVIRGMFDQYLRKTVEPPARDPNLRDVIIVDVDGTVALVEPGGRSHYDWKRVGEDSVRWPVVRAIMGMAKETGALIMFVSGRDAVCYPQTEKWIKEQAHMPVASADMLRMRPVGDTRKDAIVKGEIYDNFIKGKYNVLGIYEDRRVMINFWRSISLGDRLFDVGDGTEY